MAVYTSKALIDIELGALLVTDLIDLDEDAGDDGANLTQRIINVTSVVDGYVGARYVVPMDDIAGSPATPALIQTAATYLLAANLLRPRTESAKQRKDYRDQAIGILTRIRDGKMVIPGGVPAGLDADDALQDGFARIEDAGADPVFAGTDEFGGDRMDDW